MRKIASRLMSVGAGACVVLSVHSAAAYGWKTHSRIVEVAVQAMRRGGTAPAPSIPPGVDPTQWSTYLAQISAAATKLELLDTGVGNPAREKTDACGYALSDNMSQVPFTRISDMNYIQVQGSQLPAKGRDPAELGIVFCSHFNPFGLNLNVCTSSDTDCSQKPKSVSAACATETTADFKNIRLGNVLGWHAASVDDHVEDVQLWDRPTSSTIVNVIADILLDPVGTAVLTIGGAIVVGIECFIDIFTGGSCSGQAEKALNLLDDVSPVKALAGSWVPGIDLSRSDDYTGMWHFIDAATFSGKTDDFNPNAPSKERGMLYEEAGPNGSPGAVDLLISAAAGDLVGVSLDADNSAGVTKYAPFDENAHSRYEWVAPTLGHVEFSPISSMAEYGFDAFQDFPTSAANLGYPLHAIGDASEPHHVAGTTAWGHRPYEEECDNIIDTQLLPPPPSCTLRDDGVEDKGSPLMTQAQMDRILLTGFTFWSVHNTDPSAATLVQDLAQQTFAIAHAAPGETVYHDFASTEYLVEAKPHTTADNEYSSSQTQMIQMLELGVGASMAFLTRASQNAVDAGPNPNAVCAPGTTYVRVDNPDAQNDFWGCSSTPGAAPVPPVNASFCIDNSECTTVQINCGVEQACSSGSTCAQGFSCIQGCCEVIPQ